MTLERPIANISNGDETRCLVIKYTHYSLALDELLVDQSCGVLCHVDV